MIENVDSALGATTDSKKSDECIADTKHDAAFKVVPDAIKAEKFTNNAISG